MRRPRVLVLGINYAPEATGIAPYTAGMARGLAEDFDVEVVTAHPHYPEWVVREGYGGWRTSEDDGPVRVHRVRHLVPKHPTGVTRILSEASFAARSIAPNVRRPDLIIAVTPALMTPASAYALGARWGVPVGVVVQDLYSRAFAELGLMGGRLNSVVHRLESNLLVRADSIATIHVRMAETIERDHGVDKRKLTVIPNWTHVNGPTHDRDARRRELGWEDGRFVLVHAGNVGRKQGLHHVLPVGRLIDERRVPARLVIIGGGAGRAELERSADGISSIEFMDALPSDTFVNTLAAADALLLHERPGLREMCAPSKLTTYFATGRPVIAATESTSAAAHEVRESGAGLLVRPGQPEALVSAIAELRSHTDLELVGERGIAYARKVLSQAAALDRYRRWSWALAERSGRASANGRPG